MTERRDPSTTAIDSFSHYRYSLYNPEIEWQTRRVFSFLLFGFLSAYANAQLSHRPPLLAGFPNRHLMLVNFPTIWKSPFGQPQTCAKQSTRGNTTCHIGISPISGLFEFQWLTTWLRSQDYDNSMGKRQRKRRQLYRMLALCICISGTTTALLPTFGKPVISCPYMFLTTPT